MVFAPDTEAALLSAAALVNRDLSDPADLGRFLTEWNWTGSREGSARELEEVRELRPRLRQLWDLPEEGVAHVVNTILSASRALPQVVTHGDVGYHLHATAPEARLADRMAVEAAMAFVDVLRHDELERLRLCAARGCPDVLVDLSKNRSRRFCSGACSNRTNVAAFRARARARPERNTAGTPERGSTV